MKKFLRQRQCKMHWFCGKVVRGKVILSEEELRHEKVRRIRDDAIK